MLFLFLPFLAAVALMQVSLAIACLRRFPATRFPALLLIFVAPIQCLSALFGDPIECLSALFGEWVFGGSISASLYGSLLLAPLLISGTICIWLALVFDYQLKSRCGR